MWISDLQLFRFCRRLSRFSSSEGTRAGLLLKRGPGFVDQSDEIIFGYIRLNGMEDVQADFDHVRDYGHDMPAGVVEPG